MADEAEKKQFQLQQIGVNPASVNPFVNSRILSADLGMSFSRKNCAFSFCLIAWSPADYFFF